MDVYRCYLYQEIQENAKRLVPHLRTAVGLSRSVRAANYPRNI